MCQFRPRPVSASALVPGLASTGLNVAGAALSSTVLPRLLGEASQQARRDESVSRVFACARIFHMTWYPEDQPIKLLMPQQLRLLQVDGCSACDRQGAGEHCLCACGWRPQCLSSAMSLSFSGNRAMLSWNSKLWNCRLQQDMLVVLRADLSRGAGPAPRRTTVICTAAPGKAGLHQEFPVLFIDSCLKLLENVLNERPAAWSPSAYTPCASSPTVWESQVLDAFRL